MGTMAQLIYGALASLDGYVADSNGNFNWSAPDEEVHAFVNDLERDTGTYLYGRRMYDVMSVWETMGTADDHPVIQDYARVWRAADKIVYSGSLAQPSTPRTRIEKQFDAEAIRTLKANADKPISVGGATLAGQALQEGLVDECWLFLNPVAVGGGLPFFPHGLKTGLELLDERRFANGVVYLRYRCLA